MQPLVGGKESEEIVIRRVSRKLERFFVELEKQRRERLAVAPQQGVGAGGAFDDVEGTRPRFVVPPGAADAKNAPNEPPDLRSTQKIPLSPAFTRSLQEAAAAAVAVPVHDAAAEAAFSRDDATQIAHTGGVGRHVAGNDTVRDNHKASPPPVPRSVLPSSNRPPLPPPPNVPRAPAMPPLPSQGATPDVPAHVAQPPVLPTSVASTSAALANTATMKPAPAKPPLQPSLLSQLPPPPPPPPQSAQPRSSPVPVAAPSPESALDGHGAQTQHNAANIPPPPSSRPLPPPPRTSVPPPPPPPVSHASSLSAPLRDTSLDAPRLEHVPSLEAIPVPGSDPQSHDASAGDSPASQIFVGGQAPSRARGTSRPLFLQPSFYVTLLITVALLLLLSHFLAGPDFLP